MKVDVRYGLAGSLAILEGCMNFEQRNGIPLNVDYLTCYGERVCTVRFFNDATDVLDGSDEGGQLGRCEVGQSGYDTRRYDEDVLRWLSGRCDGRNKPTHVLVQLA